MNQDAFFYSVEPLLKEVKKPSRYLGGENGSIDKDESSLRIVLCFPDLYEIGMSNNAMRILYTGLNSQADVFCDRVFTPADDFATALRHGNMPLFGLDSHLPIRQADILAFTIGFELAATNILFTLDLGQIPLLKSERTEAHPIVLAGGPGISNPAPFASFFDAVWIGEAENAFFELSARLATMKKNGAPRNSLLAELTGHPSVWIPGKKAVRHIFDEFSSHIFLPAYPKAILKPVQDHGVVEIMRGCPNGCRFCHAGYYYRPCRYKEVSAILAEIEHAVSQGFTSISLSSLSSGDFPGILELTRYLNGHYANAGISFQLPSLKVESFSLSVIEEISGVRKSSLTFAVETPTTAWQLAINKLVTLEKIIEIIKAAEIAGYRIAKFYFMIGLPSTLNDESEMTAIIDFISGILSATKVGLNVTISTFVPKPHTPYQNAGQLDEQEALRRIYAIKDAFRKNSRVKISYNSPLMARVEGLIARGGMEVGDVILDAYRAGCVFDAWDDHFAKDTWRSLLTKHEALFFKPGQQPTFAWHEVMSRISNSYFECEREKSETETLTAVCSDNCSDLCGVCNKQIKIASPYDTAQDIHRYLAALKPSNIAEPQGLKPISYRTRILFRFQRLRSAAFYAHHDFHAMFAYALQKSGLSVEYTQGFNPMPRLELSEPLPLGFESYDEYGLVVVNQAYADLAARQAGEILANIQQYLPLHVAMLDMRLLEIVDGIKNHSLSSLYWGSSFRLTFMHEIALDDLIDRLREDLSRAPTRELQAVNLTSTGQNDIVICLPASGIKEWGLPALLGRALGRPLMQYPVHGSRLEQFAKSKASGEPISYFECFGHASCRVS